MSEPKEMKAVFFTPKRNQIMIDNMVAAVRNFFVKNRGLDKLIIEVRDCEQLDKKEATIQKLISALEQYEDVSIEKVTGVDYSYGECTELTEEVFVARDILKEVRPEPIIIYDEDINLFDNGGKSE